MRKKNSETRHGITEKLPPRKNGCFGNMNPQPINNELRGKSGR